MKSDCLIRFDDSFTCPIIKTVLLVVKLLIGVVVYVGVWEISPLWLFCNLLFLLIQCGKYHLSG